MDLTSNQLGQLIRGMHSAYVRGENAMQFAREVFRSHNAEGRNQRLATLVAYDLQAGTYVDAVRTNPGKQQQWCRQLADLIEPLLPQSGTLLEVGVGEATTLSGVITELRGGGRLAFGFDISWSRIKVGRDWLNEQQQSAELFVADLLNIPLADNSIDVVYSSHSLEPNGGCEEEAIAECLRVARCGVVLIEPLFELASPEAQARMQHHGYVRGLRETSERLGAEIVEYRLLEHISNPLNPSGVLTLRKSSKLITTNSSLNVQCNDIWQCPLTGAKLARSADSFFAQEVGIVYPVLTGIPLLRSEHAVIASMFHA